MIENRRSNKNRVIAGLLSLVLGTFGVHKFYLRDIGGGIFYIFLFFITAGFWFPVTGILGFFEAIRIFNMTDKEFDEKYNEYESRHSRRWKPKRTNGRRKPQRNKTSSRRKQNRKVRRKPIPRKNPFKKSGIQKYEDYNLKGAVQDLNQSLKIAPHDPDIHFYLSAAHSLLEEKNEAFSHLKQAVSNGLKDLSKIETTDALAFVRIQDEFEDFKNSGYKKYESNVDISEREGEEQMDDVLLSQLNKLSDLRKKGIITEEEYVIEKRKLVKLSS